MAFSSSGYFAKSSPAHPLSKSGPINNRARKNLTAVAAQFGEVIETNASSVRVKTRDHKLLTLSYEQGNFIFSRVYNLTIRYDLPEDSSTPSDIFLKFSGKQPHFVQKADRKADLSRLNAAVAEMLQTVDLHSAYVRERHGHKELTVVPLGGAFVWVLIPPVFKNIAFPQGEPKRLMRLVDRLAS
jgi:hypothetical protein